ncbi:unnamed protein product [Acanthoscelides obtectus]|uniref:Uncharacterized protein n=1 Tax=Acanthoscelides obtectus TaxID=200917 RepID=A0A9P0JQ54_ACAOB|nr:unnamed protein product [Acanthoscelides obtectus]CAK1661985.1 Outer dense fiber protein 2 [Acanthoscelides obtectus]
MVCLENQHQSSSSPRGLVQNTGTTSPQRQQQYGKGRPPCPADIEARLQEYSANTQNLEFQLCNMENDLRAIQDELSAVQTERAHLEHHRKMFCPPVHCFLPPCMSPTCMAGPPCQPLPCKFPPYMLPPPCTCAADTGPSLEQQMKGLKEQYVLLQEDYKLKVKEVSTLRAENQNLKEAVDKERANLKVYKDKIKKHEEDIRSLMGDRGKGAGLKDRILELEKELADAKQTFREAQDELEQLRSKVQDQQQQMDDYRNRYLEAQQQVEEQRRQIDLMELENVRISEQINMEIQRVKNQFQRKLEELMPLPGILKDTQMALKKAQQEHLLAERTNESVAGELTLYKDKLAALANQLNDNRDQVLGQTEKDGLLQKIADLEKEIEDAREESYDLRSQVGDLGEKLTSCRLESDSRAHEIVQLESNIENVRIESARQVARTKDRCELVRKSMQNQINDLERQVMHCQAQVKSSLKDKDEIREKMQAQICSLTENFEDATLRIRNLRDHVDILKNTYGAVGDPYLKPFPPDPCSCCADSRM